MESLTNNRMKSVDVIVFFKLMFAAIAFNYLPKVEASWFKIFHYNLPAMIPSWFIELFNDTRVVSGFVMSIIAIVVGVLKGVDLILSIRAKLKASKQNSTGNGQNN